MRTQKRWIEECNKSFEQGRQAGRANAHQDILEIIDELIKENDNELTMNGEQEPLIYHKCSKCGHSEGEFSSEIREWHFNKLKAKLRGELKE